MAIISGVGVEVDGVSSLSAWKINQRAMPAEFATSDAPGGQARACGNTDWQGIYRAYGHTPAHWPGDSIAFKGDVDSNYGVSGTGIVKSITIETPVEENGLISSVVEFEANGALTAGSAAATKGSSPAIYCAVSRKINWDGSDVNIRHWRLKIFCKNRPYADTSTGGLVKRVKGVLDARFDYSLYDNNASNFPTLNSTAIAQFYVDATEYWELTWGKITDIDNYGGDHEGQVNVGATIRGAWTAQDGTSIGTIKNPGTPSGTTKWP